MMHGDEFPKRVRVLVLGGGIHGCGVAHDLASRGWRDVHLLERSPIGRGSSSQEPVLVSDDFMQSSSIFGLSEVSARLDEQGLLGQIMPDVVSSSEFLMPMSGQSVFARLLMTSKLAMRSLMASRLKLGSHRKLNASELSQIAPQITCSTDIATYCVIQGVARRQALIKRVADSARMLGATFSEGVEVVRLETTADGWEVTVRNEADRLGKISALYVVNCLGPWANTLLERSGITPTHRGIITRRTTALIGDLGLKSGVFLPVPRRNPRRMVYLLPCQNTTFLGVAESTYSGDLDAPQELDEDIDFLIDACNHHLKKKLARADIIQADAKFVWTPMLPTDSLSHTSAPHLLGERGSGRGLLLTVYNHDVISYRRVAQFVGDRVSTHFGEYTESGTANKSNWTSDAIVSQLNHTEIRAERSDNHA